MRDKNYHNSQHWRRAWGALASGNRAAYLAIGIRAFSPVTRVLDALMRIVPAVEVDPAWVPAVFMVGPPRSGATVIFQSLTSALPAVYPTNAHALFPFLGSQILNGINRVADRRPVNLKSFLGYTSGLRGVYEANEFFDWPEVRSKALSVEQKQRLRARYSRLIRQLAPRAGECVIMKNARRYDAVAALHQAVPELVFLRVRRNLADVVASAVRAYRDMGSFHPVPPQLHDVSRDDPVEFAVRQICAIEESLDDQWRGLPQSVRLDVCYKEFCDDPRPAIETLAYNRLNLPRGSVTMSRPICSLRPSCRKKVSQDEMDRIRQLLDRQGRPCP
jgi:hypothetical protein